MRRILLSAAILLVAGAFVVIATGAATSESQFSAPKFRIELDNAFGLVNGEDFKVAGVRAGKIQHIDLCYTVRHNDCLNPLHALITVKVTELGFGQLRTDTFCQERPQSLIGEYFVDCEPGLHGQVLKPGSTIPVTHTRSTIPADLVQNIMRLPYRQRFTVIINELGAAVASRSEDLQTALRRAVPAITQTDNLLNLLANDSRTIQQLNVNADTVITALADHKDQVNRFITEANNLSAHTANNEAQFVRTWHDLPAFLEQLKPALAKLQNASNAQIPVLNNLNESTGHVGATTTGPDQLKNFFVNLVPFSHASQISLACGDGSGQPGCPNGGLSLGRVSVTGKPAVQAAQPLINHLRQFTGPSNCTPQKRANCLPELGNNLAIVLRDIDNRNRAVEGDARSPQGRGYTGLEALLQYVFNQTVAINAFSSFGHMLSVDAFFSPACSPYATPQTIASNLKAYSQGQFPQDPRTCYSFTGPNQPGVNETDPTNPAACVPDPGGGPPGAPGPSTSACKAPGAADVSSSRSSSGSTSGGTAASSGGPTAQNTGQSGAGQAVAGGSGSPGSPSRNVTPGSSPNNSGGQTQQLLNYLLAP